MFEHRPGDKGGEGGGSEGGGDEGGGGSLGDGGSSLGGEGGGGLGDEGGGRPRISMELGGGSGGWCGALGSTGGGVSRAPWSDHRNESTKTFISYSSKHLYRVQAAYETRPRDLQTRCDVC